MYECIYLSIYLSIYLCTHVSIHLCVCNYARLCACMHACKCVRSHTYEYSNVERGKERDHLHKHATPSPFCLSLSLSPLARFAAAGLSMMTALNSVLTSPAVFRRAARCLPGIVTYNVSWQTSSVGLRRDGIPRRSDFIQLQSGSFRRQHAFKSGNPEPYVLNPNQPCSLLQRSSPEPEFCKLGWGRSARRLSEVQGYE